MLSYKEQIKKFKKCIHIGPTSTSDLLKWLKEKVDVREISFSDLRKGDALMITYNAKNCILNKDHLSVEQMKFHIFQVVPNEKSAVYYNEQPYEEIIYVVLEEKTGYIYSGSNLLFLELEVKQGVSEEEYNTEGLQFRSILAHIAIEYCKIHEDS